MILANARASLRSLWASKRRSALALLGITIGIAAFITLVSVGLSIKHAAMQQFVRLGTDFLVIQKGWSARFGNDNTNDSTLENVETMPLVLPQIKEASPVGSNYSSASYQGHPLSNASSLLGVQSDFLEINRLDLKDGRFFNPLDGAAEFCILGHGVAQEFQKQHHTTPIGQTLKIDDRLFTVIGTLESAPSGSLQPFFVNSSILIPFASYQRYVEKAQINYIIARTHNKKEDTATLEASLQHFFKIFTPGTNPQITTAEVLIKQLNSQMDLYTLLLGSIGGISLLVGGIGIMNIMLVAVTERRKEIGIRRAIGARKKDILTQFLTESTVLCLSGGLLGVLIGTIASISVCYYKDIAYSFSAWPLALGTCISLLLGLFFGIYPARQAAALPPVVALRSE